MIAGQQRPGASSAQVVLAEMLRGSFLNQSLPDAGRRVQLRDLVGRAPFVYYGNSMGSIFGAAYTRLA